MTPIKRKGSPGGGAGSESKRAQSQPLPPPGTFFRMVHRSGEPLSSIDCSSVGIAAESIKPALSVLGDLQVIALESMGQLESVFKVNNNWQYAEEVLREIPNGPPGCRAILLVGPDGRRQLHPEVTLDSVSAAAIARTRSIYANPGLDEYGKKRDFFVSTVSGELAKLIIERAELGEAKM